VKPYNFQLIYREIQKTREGLSTKKKISGHFEKIKKGISPEPDFGKFLNLTNKLKFTTKNQQL